MQIWVVILLFALIYWGMVYFDAQGGWQSVVYKPYHSMNEVALNQPDSDLHFGQGKLVFEQFCAGCHDSTGSGRPAQAPPLAGSDWVNGLPDRLIRIPQLGLTGPIKINGQLVFFPSGMPPIGATLSDEDLAAVLSYIRQAWSNHASPISPEQIKRVRSEIIGQQPTGEAALLRISVQ